MASRLSWLAECKAAQLKALASAIGANSSGTKPALIAQLQEHLPLSILAPNGRNKSPKKAQETHDIISIDMGIRNLAYCRLSLPITSEKDAGSRASKPTISEWARVAVSAKAAQNPDEPERSQVKEAFDPATYSAHAYALLTHLLFRSACPPTQILIERQRFRSMGGSSVQEWTLRVNMFEAMLYAVLKTFNERGIWDGSVHAIAPAKVSKFWLGQKEGVDEEGGRGSKSAKTKTAKINLVAEWLEAGERFRLVGGAEELGQAYSRKSRGEKKVLVHQTSIHGLNGEKSKLTELGKLDDPADCLLQGMAWIEWEANRTIILSKNFEALEELGQRVRI